MQKIRICGVLASVLIFAAAQAQSVDEIIEKHIAALGGLEKLQAVKSLKVAGTSVVTAMGFEAGFTRQSKRPHFIRLDVNVQGQNMVQAYNGKTAWQIVPFTGNLDPQPMPEFQAQGFRLQADMDGPLIDYKKKGHKVELVGKEDLEGTEVYRLKISLKSGEIIQMFIDTEHYLPLKSTAKVKGPGGNEIEAETYFSDYKPVAGMMMAHSITMKNPTQGSVEVTISEVETNVDIDDSLFKMPEKK
ncbi:MAG: outer membrane lipoprotein-sorting protein [bacterium]